MSTTTLPPSTRCLYCRRRSRFQDDGNLCGQCMDNAALILSENARLFHAAPDLLLECRSQRWAFRELLSGDWDGSEEGVRSSIRTLTNVIVKAEGRQRRSA